MQTRPMTRVRGSVDLTRFDPIRNTPGTPDYVAQSGSIQGTPRSFASKGSTIRPGAIERYSEPWRVPSLPRRNYIPTVSKVELE